MDSPSRQAILVIDQGNSKCKLTAYRGDEIVGRKSVEGALSIEAVEQTASECNVDAVVYCSVAKVDVRLVESMRHLFGDEGLLVVTHHTPLPIKIDYATTETLGLDRVAVAVAAAAIYPGKSALLVDAGTAVTEDFITADGTYLGGRISPGLMLRFKALHEFTSRLPMVSPEGEAPWIATDTATCIRSGVVRGLEGELLHMAASAPTAIDMIILTGGDAPLLAATFEGCGIPSHHHPDLLAEGLRRIYLYNEDI